LLPDGRHISYVIDGRNRRVGKRVNGTLTQGFLYESQLRVAAELDGAGSVTAIFVYGGSPNSPEYAVRSGTAFRTVSNQIGSPVLVVDSATGVVAERMEYDEFGSVTSDTSPAFQPIGFAGGLYDPQTGLTRYGSRDYDATSGRWTVKDQIRFHGGDANLYGYVLNDPANGVDPNGTNVLFPAIPVLAALGALCQANPSACAAAVAAAEFAVAAILSSIIAAIGQAIADLVRPAGDSCGPRTSAAPPRFRSPQDCLNALIAAIAACEAQYATMSVELQQCYEAAGVAFEQCSGWRP
jgi:RHS repeat-associated protein